MGQFFLSPGYFMFKGDHLDKSYMSVLCFRCTSACVLTHYPCLQVCTPAVASRSRLQRPVLCNLSNRGIRNMEKDKGH